MKNLDLLWLKEFKEVTVSDEKNFKPYMECIEFADCTFSGLYAWQRKFQYAYKMFGDVLAVLEIKKDLSVILFYKNASEISSVMQQLYELFKEADLSLTFRYVAKSQLDFYKNSAEAIGKTISYSASLDDSDYIYEVSDFLCLDGKKNKGKRIGLNSLNRMYPELSIKKYENNGKNGIIEDCYHIFDQWCESHTCENCVYGCEKEAFRRFVDVFDVTRHEICVSYDGEKALSFAVNERINEDTACCIFQKNAFRIRGLTYWLNREMLLQDNDIRYLNLGEDMGINGIRIDKNSFHPCYKKEKYVVRIQ